MFKHLPQDPANVNTLKTMVDPYIVLLRYCYTFPYRWNALILPCLIFQLEEDEGEEDEDEEEEEEEEEGEEEDEVEEWEEWEVEEDEVEEWEEWEVEEDEVSA